MFKYNKNLENTNYHEKSTKSVLPHPEEWGMERTLSFIGRFL